MPRQRSDEHEVFDEQGTSESGQIIAVLAWIGFFIALIFLVSCWAVAHHGDHSLSNHHITIQQIAYHDYCDSDDSCYNEDNGHSYDNYDRNRNRNRNRGAFSPGPFDRSPVDIHDNNVCISPDCSSHQGSGDQDKNPPRSGK